MRLTTLTPLTENPPVPSRLVLRCALVAGVIAAAVAAPAQAQSPSSAQYAYVAVGGGALFRYGLAGDALTPLTPPSLPTSASANQVVVSSDGRSVYVTTQAGIDQYDQGAGTLSPKNPQTVPVASGAAGIAETPDRTSVYATGLFSPTILLFDVGTGGTLAPKATPTLSLPGGGVPAGIAVSPDGQSVYVSFSGLVPPSSAGIAQYTVGAGGALTPKNLSLIHI